MPTRNVVLTKHHEEVIDHLVKTGRYQNASEVLRDGLRLVEQREAREEARLAALKEAAGIGFRDIEEGRFREIDDGSLDEFIRGLGRQAGELVKKAGR
ncbi:type II toxin-antitoxin system ParD family antitoxin [Mesorhizobium sp. VK23B]|uniref:Type II toxin-antitoxin system ParD family antitoxin n=1 Tax=Mesorhizobium dulcispinae TaxID=3072316 RepID=A0ABU4XPF6_9HYPH|nr:MULTISPECIES: type II toxin-antitoxin system ParD family antitoxin [unclassified Mesorhizobium]MDX8469544.1 type II toxin-antitoxin system ParD family antitoxin [Mesorhizobium sp. VK23B]MDX8475883.1 type II toxin-antitoxin system ParD family antitoxin [Mesorhizobium sp. VK23A]